MGPDDLISTFYTVMDRYGITYEAAIYSAAEAGAAAGAAAFSLPFVPAAGFGAAA
jgi:hypothetical protein